MQSKLRIVMEIVLIVVCGTLGSILVGVLGHGPHIFSWRNPEFQFLSFGLATSALAAICWRSGLLITLLYVLPFAAVCSIPSRKLFWFGFINAALFFGFAAFVFDRIWDALHNRLPFGKFIVLGLLFAVFEFCKTLPLALAAGTSNLLEPAQANAVLRGMLGIGVGLGVETADVFVARHWSREGESED